MTSKVQASAAADVSPDDPERIAERYRITGLLGRGGMGAVYRVIDEADGRPLALKRLGGRDGARPAPHAIELFEREFHTLNQLAHPRVVRAFDYGIDADTPYYTLELLDGGDLRTQAPMSPQGACEVAYDICSALSLLHSRRLVHRDVTPRNIRLTGDGRAKLIDFGLLSPMGPVQVVAGTPAYVPPEVVMQLDLDGRSDLFSLGCTLYYALTGTAAFSCRGFGELRNAWRHVPLPLRKLAPDVPEPLERLVAELMRLDVGSRPRSAAEVMDRLRPLLPAAPEESLSVAHAHLSAPTLVGRGVHQVRLRKAVFRAVRGRGGGFLITGEAGMGRSRMLDVFVLEAKLLGSTVGRAAATAGGPWSVAQSLAAQLHRQAPTASVEAASRDESTRRALFGDQSLQDPAACWIEDLDRPGLDEGQLQTALRSWLVSMAETRTVALAVDDFERVDEPSAAVLASLALAASTCRLTYAFVCSDPTRETAAMAVLQRHARVIELTSLSLEDTEKLLESVFGDVDNLQATSRALHGLSAGRPRDCMLMAQHLVNRGAVVYESGGWRLPPQVEAGALPQSMEAALEARIGALSGPARELACVLSAYVVRHLSRTQLLAALEVPARNLDTALEELRRAHLLTGDPDGYAVPPAGAAALRDLPDTTRPELHDRLADLAARAGAPAIVCAHHRLQGTEPVAAAIDLATHLVSDARIATMEAGMRAIGCDATAEVVARADEVARRADCKVAQRFALWPTLGRLVVEGAAAGFVERIEPQWLPILERESGLNAYRELTEVADPATRAVSAFAAASERHGTLPEHERVLSPTEAIRELMFYVGCGIGIGARFHDCDLLASFPPLLSPLTPLHPMVDAMHRNAQAVVSTSVDGDLERSRGIVIDLIERLAQITDGDQDFTRKIRDVSQLHLRVLNISLGIDTDDGDSVERVYDPADKVYAAQIEAVAARYRGDRLGAETYRRRAELLALEHRTAGIFSPLITDLVSHAAVHDVTGVKSVRERLHQLATELPGWVAWRDLSDVYYHRLRAEPDLALAGVTALRDAWNQGRVPFSPYCTAVAAEVEMLVDRGQAALAKERGELVLAECRQRHLGAKHREISCSLALADAALGNHTVARERVEAAIAEQQALGARRLPWGITHEYLARLAIYAGDKPAFERARRAVAEAYGADGPSLLSRRYRRLIEEALQAGMVDAPVGPSQARAPGPVSLESSEAWTGTAEDALSLLCGSGRIDHGWLFLMTDAGLRMVAQTCPPDDEGALLAFAQAQLELEVDDGTCTQATDQLTNTAAPMSTYATGDAAETPGLRGVPLTAQRDGHVYLVGVAVVIGTTSDAWDLAPAASSLARLLMDADVCRPQQAA